jgi:hypothetical protein
MSITTRKDSVFATSAFWTSTTRDGWPRREPSLTVHGKAMGTTMTLCGQSTLSWPKFWDIGFETVRAGRCPRCTTLMVMRLPEATAD